jgi:seryl-tRNA synthetase
MIDIKLLREKPEFIKQKTAEKQVDVSIDEIIELDTQRRDILQAVESLRQQKNDISDQMKQGTPDQDLINEAKLIKVELAKKEELLAGYEKELQDLLQRVPNPHFDDVPVGDESASVEVGVYGGQDSGARDHLELATERGWLDFERGSKVAGAKFYYVKGDLALLENAVVQYALELVTSKGFIFMTVPHMVKSRIATGSGFAPRTSEQADEYYVEDEDLTLIATAEIPLTGYHADETLSEDQLPLFYVGYSPCYRKEAGAYGKHTRGLFRVHQFNKLEMYAFCLPEKSAEVHEMIRGIEEEIWQNIGIPYHVINIASGDLGAPAAKKYDIEYWSKVDGTYRELTSCSNCTDFQARNLNIKVKRTDGSICFAHTLNGTAVSMARTLVAIIEHFQNEDGTVRVPKVLQPYMRGREVI